MARIGSSKYLDGYLDENARRGLGRGLTVGSYLAGELRGKALNYVGRYAAALRIALSHADCFVGVSAGGKEAYYPCDRVAQWDDRSAGLV